MTTRFRYNRPISQDEQKRFVINLYESGIAEEFIALQLDLEIPAVISILKESDAYKGNSGAWATPKYANPVNVDAISVIETKIVNTIVILRYAFFVAMGYWK